MGFDVEEYRKNRKNQQSEETKKSGFDVETYRKSRYAPQDGEEIASRVNSWLKSNESLVNSYNARYGENSSSYRADYSDWLSNVTTKTGDLEKEADAIKSLLGQYSDFYDSDSVKSIIEALDSSLSIQKEIVDNSTKDYEYWSQWKDEGAYKRDMADWLEDNAEVDEDKIEQRREVYQSNLDRIAKLEAEIKAYQNTPATNDDEPFLARLGRYLSGMPSDNSIMPPTQSTEETELQKLVSELDAIKAENRRYDREQKSLDDYFVPETEEFLQNAASRDYGNPTIDDIEGYWNSTDTSLPEPTDKLGFYLNNYLPMLDEIESRQKDAASRGEDYRTTMPVEYVAMYHEGYEGSWEELEDREINIYYNLLKTEGQEAAYKFLDDMKPLLNKRATQTMSDKVSQAELFSLEQIFYNVASVPANIIGGAASFMDDAINIAKGNDINPYSSAHRWQNVAQAVRQDTANDINEATGNAALPYLGTTFGDVYQALMSGADSLVGIGLGGTTYGILMGMGAASSEAKELYEKGASIGQMAAGGILAGAAEMVFEKVSIDKFVKMGDTKSMKALLVNTLKQGGVEASEEMLTEIANTLTDAIVMGSQSDLQGYLDKYVSQGYTESQAIVKALFNDVAPNVINAGIGGLISGGGMGSIGSIGSYANYQGQVKKHGQSIIDNGGVDTLKALALDMAGVKGSTNAKSIGNLAGKVDSKASAKNVGRLSVKIEETMGTQNTSDIQTALTEKGLSKSEANRVAALLTTNAPLTEEQQAEIEGNEKIAEVVKELVNNKDSVVNQRKLNLLAARLGIDMKSSTINGESTEVGGVTLKKEVDVSDRVSKGGKAINEATGDEVNIDKGNAIAKVETIDGERVIFYNTDKGVVRSDDISYASEDDGVLYEGVSDMNPAIANAVINNYDGSVPVKTYIKGMREGIVLYGAHNFQAVGKDISVNSDLADLSAADQSFALKLGAQFAKMNAEKAENDLKTAIKNAAEKAEAEGNTSTTSSKKGGVRFENGTRAKTSAQKRVVNLAKHLSRAIGIDIVFYDARTTKDKNGKKANGYFDPNDNSIHLDLQNAVTDSKTIVFTLSHELVHFIKKWSPAKYNTFSKFLMEQYAEHGVSTSTLLAQKMAALETTDADLAYEEMIADACERMLLDSNAVVKLMELRKADLELFEKIKLHVLELLNKIRDAFKGVDPNTDEGIALQKMEDVLGKLHEMFEDAAVDAAKNYQVAGTLNTESVSVSEDGTIQMQMKQYQQTGRSTLLNYLKGQYGDNNANDLISTIDSIYNVMAEIKEDTALSVFGNWQDTDVELDAEGRPIFTTSINNGDYELNQDFSRVCKKRRQLNFVLNMLAEDPAFEASHLTKIDFAKINKAIKEHGFEIACALCFVDSKRFRQAEWADSFANTWNDILGSMKADSKPLSRFNFATKSANMADEGIQIDPSKPISYRKWSDGKATETRHYKNLDDLLENDGNNNVKAIARLLRDNPNLRHEFRGADIIASDGFDMIQRLAPDVRGILDGWGGSSVPKPSSNDAIYDNSILNIDGYNAEKAFAVGGVRMNSFSDFMAHMFFDYAQAFADLSAKNLPMHSYTKELDFARLFGLTGGKVNMSAIAAIRSNAPNIDKIKDKTSKEAAKDFEKSIAGLDISRLAEKLGKSESEITYDDVIQNLDDVDYVWADESIDVKSATLLQTGILYDNLTDAQAAYCYELIRNGQIEEAFRVAGEKNVNRGYAKHLGIITVGVSRAHILKLLRDPTIRMVIPYHKSGLNPAVAKALNIAFYDDFTDVQNTSVKKGDKQVGITGDDAKVKWKNPKNGKTENKKLKDFSFYDYFGKTVDGAFYDGKATAAKYIDWCENGVFDETVGDYVYYLSGGGYILASELHAQGVEVVPKFSEFASEENYYKLVEDFDCYDTITGEHSAQEAVDFFHDGLPADYKDVLTRALKAEQKVHDDFKDHLDNKGLRDEIMDIVKPHGYTPSDLSATWGEIVEAVGEENVGEATEQFTDVENTATIKQQKKKTSDNTYESIGKELLYYEEGDLAPDLTLVETLNDRTGNKEVTIKHYGQKPKGYVPKKIAYCYKLFEQHTDGTLHALFAGAKNAVPIGEWRYAQGFPRTDEGVSGMNLRERYGWHLSAGLPSAPHLMSSKSFERGYPSKAAYGHKKGSKRVWVRMAYDASTDFNSVADSTGKQNDIYGLIPFGGYYAFKENNQSEWVISSAVKIDKILTEEERQQILKDAGYDEYEAWRLRYQPTPEERAARELANKERAKAKARDKKLGIDSELSESTKAMREGIKSRIIDNPELNDGIKKQAKASQKDTDSVKGEFSDGVKKQRKKVYETKLPDNAENIAKEHFGTTNDWSETGWLLTDGTQLDFSGRHWENDPDSEIDLGESYYRGKRNMEHYEIAEAFPELREYSQMEYRDIHLEKFLNRGNIRIVGKGIVDIETMPTEEQFDKLRGYFMANVDKGAVIGIGVGGLNYREGTSASTIIEGIRDYFSKSRANQSDLMRFHTDDDGVIFQKKQTTNRTLLANALESAAQNDIERNKIAQYKEKISLIESEQAKLAEVREKANELRFTKGRTPDETKQMKALDFEAKQIENRINTYDRQLLNLESTAALKNVLQREKEMARKRAEQKGKEALAAYKEKAAQTQRELMKRNQESRERNKARVEKTALRRKIRKVVKDLNSLLKNGNKKRNIKEEMQDTVASSLALADILFNDDIRNEDIVRLGVDSVTAKESEALNKYRDLLEERDRLQAKIETIYGNGMVRETLLEEVGKVTEELDKANGRIAYLNNKLSDLFERERARLNRSTVDTIINDLITEYAKLETSENGYIKNAYSDHMKKRLETLKETLQGKIARDMDIYQLSELYDTFKAIEHMVRHSNSLFREGRLEDLMTIISNVQGELYESSTEQKDGGVIANALESAWNEFTWNNLRPVDAFERLGSPTLEKLFWDFVHAMGVAAMDVREAGEVIAKAREKYGYSKWNMNIADTPYTTRDGLTFKPSLADKLSIYAYSQRDQAEDHMVDGGFTYDTGITYKETENGKTYVRRKLSNTYRLSKETIGSIIGSLTQEQRDYVDAILPYLTDMGKKGNEVSMVMYGIELFGEKVYFPLQSSRDYMSSTTQTLGATPTMSSLSNSGFTHQTKPGADNPIVLRGFDDVVLDHIEKMSNYHALVLPIENLRRVFDNVSRDTDRNSLSTRALIGSRFGVEAQKYFEQWLTDINGGIMPSGAKNFFGKLFSRAKGMSVAANLSVVAQQYSSIIRAMEVVHPKYFTPFIYGEAKKSDTKQYEELLKYAPIAIIKEMGGFDVGSKGRVKDYIGYEGARKDAKYINKKIDDLSMWGAGAMDKLGWVTIWKAIKAEVASEKKLSPGTAAFYEACKLRFTEVVTKTQVYDSVASRSGYMRSQHDAVKYATSFMGEPTAIVGRYFGAGVELVRAIKSKNKARVKSAAMRFGRTATVIAVAGALGNLAKALVYAGRDDDEDEALLEKWMGNFAEALKDDLIPLNYLPFGRDLVSIIEGWDVERPDTTLIADMVTSVKKMADGDVTLDDSLNLVGSVGNFFGKPLKNVIREIKSAINVIGDISDDIRPTNMGGAFAEGFTGNERTKTEKLYDAIISGDTARSERLKSGYKDEKAITTAIRAGLRENDSRIKDAAQARIDGDISEYTRIVRDIIAEGNFVQDIVVGAVNAEINAINSKADVETYEEDASEKVSSIYRGSDINDAFENGDNSLAVSIIDDLINTKVANGMEEKSAKSYVKSSITSYWKPLYIAAYKSGNTEEMRRIRMILKESGLYGRASDILDTCKAWLKEKN